MNNPGDFINDNDIVIEDPVNGEIPANNNDNIQGVNPNMVNLLRQAAELRGNNNARRFVNLQSLAGNANLNSLIKIFFDFLFTWRCFVVSFMIVFVLTAFILANPTFLGDLESINAESEEVVINVLLACFILAILLWNSLLFLQIVVFKFYEVKICFKKVQYEDIIYFSPIFSSSSLFYYIVNSENNIDRIFVSFITVAYFVLFVFLVLIFNNAHEQIQKITNFEMLKTAFLRVKLHYAVFLTINAVSSIGVFFLVAEFDFFKVYYMLFKVSKYSLTAGIVPGVETY